MESGLEVNGVVDPPKMGGVGAAAAELVLAPPNKVDSETLKPVELKAWPPNTGAGGEAGDAAVNGEVPPKMEAAGVES